MKNTLVAILTVSTGLLTAAFISHADDHSDGTSNATRVWIGYAIAPVALNLRGRNRELVGIGSYIVNAQGACNDCHTHPAFMPGGDPYSGEPEVVNSEQYLTGGRQFGPFTSANLTPDQFGRPAGLTFGEFKNALRTGLDPDGPRDPLPPLLQVMPWPVYAKMSDRDLRAIYEYLRAIPPRPDNPAPGP
jgi:mono/diheme cytochrome c family protein